MFTGVLIVLIALPTVSLTSEVLAIASVALPGICTCARNEAP
jgi:hypothetical protein